MKASKKIAEYHYHFIQAFVHIFHDVRAAINKSPLRELLTTFLLILYGIIIFACGASFGGHLTRLDYDSLLIQRTGAYATPYHSLTGIVTAHPTDALFTVKDIGGNEHLVGVSSYTSYIFDKDTTPTKRYIHPSDIFTIVGESNYTEPDIFLAKSIYVTHQATTTSQSTTKK